MPLPMLLLVSLIGNTFSQLWLLLAKTVILAGLLLTRRHLIRVHYAGKWF
jgi:hypothetical protein